MLNETENTSNKKRKLFPGINADAKTLGVSRQILYKMLLNIENFGKLKNLRKRYLKLLEEKPEAIRNFIKANIKEN